MSKLTDILEFNQKFVEKKAYEDYTTTKFPDKKIVIFSCMDTRLTQLLPVAMNLKNGDAKIVKNAGATITHPFGSMMRSILVAIYELGVEEVFVVGHRGCGMSGVDTKKMKSKMIEAGIDKEVIKTLKYSGVDVDHWLHGFDCVEESVKESVDQIQNHPLMAGHVKIHGLIMDPETGALDVVVDGN